MPAYNLFPMLKNDGVGLDGVGLDGVGLKHLNAKWVGVPANYLADGSGRIG